MGENGYEPLYPYFPQEEEEEMKVFLREYTLELVQFWLDQQKELWEYEPATLFAIEILRMPQYWFLLDFLKDDIIYVSDLGKEVYDKYVSIKETRDTYSEIGDDIVYCDKFIFYAEASHVCHVAQYFFMNMKTETSTPLVIATIAMNMLTGSSATPQEYEDSEPMAIMCPNRLAGV
jgi:hypothetical protein